MPPLGPIPREESGRGYVGRREGFEHEWNGAEFERERGNYDQRRAEFERGGVYYDPMGAEFEKRRWKFDERLGFLWALAASTDLREIDPPLELRIDCILVPVAERQVEVLEGEIGQMKSEISDLQTQVSNLKKDISVIHDKFDSKFSILEEMLKKVLEGQTNKISSEVREVTDSQGSGKNPKPIKQREGQEMEISNGTEKMPPLGPIPRERSCRGYVERREGVGHEWRGVEFERRGAEFERRGLDYD
ncbi:hypothetical protein M5K25_010730 [Dendrobium thyrsiflorum]|uniref:Uncharacterized protein n=1 Tax=Dendrobium thyrsiflorum TaxID=117978 RepID=A0ABD0V0V2_DENTH